MRLADAVAYLHPEYRAHRTLTAATANCYPAAIPKDLVNLIRCHLGFRQPTGPLKTQQQQQDDYDNFIAKYGAEPLNCRAGGLRLDLKKLQATFPHCSDLEPGNTVQIKCLSNRHIITKNVIRYIIDNIVLVHVVMGHLTGFYLGRLLENSIYAKFEHKAQFDSICSCYLPFNFYGEQRGEHKYLVNPATMESVQIIDVPGTRFDYANRIHIFSECSQLTLLATVV